MSTKIQINSLAALERLIGGDSELEIGVRDSVVQDFAKKHLKSIADVQVGSLKSMVAAEIQKYIQEKLGSFVYTGWRASFQLTVDVKDAIKDEVDLVVRDQVKSICLGMIENKDLDRIIKSEVNYQYKEVVTRTVKEKLANILKGLE